LDDGDDPGLGRAAAAVGVDEHRDPDAPLGRVERRERDLDAAQLGIAEDPAEDGAGATHQCPFQ
jgi:hypothetical protein